MKSEPEKHDALRTRYRLKNFRPQISILYVLRVSYYFICCFDGIVWIVVTSSKLYNIPSTCGARQEANLSVWMQYLLYF